MSAESQILGAESSVVGKSTEMLVRAAELGSGLCKLLGLPDNLESHVVDGVAIGMGLPKTVESTELDLRVRTTADLDVMRPATEKTSTILLATALGTSVGAFAQYSDSIQ